MIGRAALAQDLRRRRYANEAQVADRGRGMDEGDWQALDAGYPPEHEPSASDVRQVVDAHATGGLALAQVLEHRPILGRSDAEVVDHLRGWWRQAAHAHGMLMTEIGDLMSRRDSLPEFLLEPGPQVEFVAGEVAAALRITQRAAEDLIDEATTLTRRLTATHDALLAGRIDVATAKAIIAETVLVALVADEHLAAVEAAALGRAETGTAAQVRAFTRRIAIKLDPAGAADREKAAVRMRHVRRGEIVDGTGDLSARLTVDELDQVWAVLDTRARAVEDDTKSLDEKRADVLVQMITKPESVGPLPGAGTVRTADLVVAASTVAGHDDDPGHLAGYGPVTAQTARRLAADATWRRVLVDPVTGRSSNAHPDATDPLDPAERHKTTSRRRPQPEAATRTLS